MLKDGTQITRLHPGSFFGERSLLKDEPPVATVRAGSDGAATFRCDRVMFNESLPSLQELIEREVRSRRDRDRDAFEISAATW